MEALYEIGMVWSKTWFKKVVYKGLWMYRLWWFNDYLGKWIWRDYQICGELAFVKFYQLVAEGKRCYLSCDVWLLSAGRRQPAAIINEGVVS